MVVRAIPGHMTMGTENAQAFVSDFGNVFNAKPAWPRDIPPHKTQEMETNPSETTLYPMVRTIVANRYMGHRKFLTQE